MQIRMCLQTAVQHDYRLILQRRASICWQLHLLLVTWLVLVFSKCPEARHVGKVVDIAAADTALSALHSNLVIVTSSRIKTNHGKDENFTGNEISDGRHREHLTQLQPSAARLRLMEQLQPFSSANRYTPRLFDIALQKTEPRMTNILTDEVIIRSDDARGSTTQHHDSKLSDGEYGQHDSKHARKKAFCQNRRVAPNTRVQYNNRSEMHARMAHHGDDKIALRSLANVAKTFTVDLIIGQCQEPLSWLKHVDCSISGNLSITVYRKCPGHGLDPAIDFSRLPCLKDIKLYNPNATSVRGTLLHHFYSNYDNLPDFTMFVKDTNKKQPTGLTIPQRVAAAAMAIDIDTGYINLADVPPLYHHQLQHNTQKDRSIQRALRNDHHLQTTRQETKLKEWLLDGGLLRDTPKVAKKAKINKDQLAWQRQYCKVYDDMICDGSSCHDVWVPNRSQSVLSRRRIRSIPREFYLLSHPSSLLWDEFNWGLVWNCFVSTKEIKINGRKPSSPLPWLHCKDDLRYA